MPQIVSDRIGVTASPGGLQLRPGAAAPVVLTVTNRGSIVDRFGLRVEGLDPAWFTCSTTEVDLLPNTTKTLDLEVHLPESLTAAAGSYTVRLSVVSREDPQAITAVELVLEVLPVGDVEMELRPELALTRRTGHFRARLTNRTNTERLVDLVATDPDQALELKLAVDRVALGPGATEEVGIAVRPHQRPLVAPPRSYRFTVLVLPALGERAEVAEPLAGAQGMLVYRAWFAVLAGLSPRLRGLALALAGLLLAAVLAVWVLGRTGVQFPWTAPAPAPTPEPIQMPLAEPQATPTLVPTVAPTTAPTSVPLPTATPVPMPAPPTINRFEVIAPSNGGRGEFLLSWDVAGADEVTIAGEPRPTTGAEPIQDLQDTQLDLRATNAGGSVTKTIGIVILRPPEIVDLTANSALVDPGQPVQLTWKTKRAERAELAGQAVEPGGGTLEMRPIQSTIYTLVADNELGRSRRSVEVDVRGSAPPPDEAGREPAGGQ